MPNESEGTESRQDLHCIPRKADGTCKGSLKADEACTGFHAMDSHRKPTGLARAHDTNPIRTDHQHSYDADEDENEDENESEATLAWAEARTCSPPCRRAWTALEFGIVHDIGTVGRWRSMHLMDR